MPLTNSLSLSIVRVRFKSGVRGKQARDGDFIGAYAQTELGHGSNVRGLETTAHYFPDTQEFEIHSPTLSSLKFWPTGMYSSTHAAVFAQMYVLLLPLSLRPAASVTVTAVLACIEIEH
jgi:alkylation response protein AidB-like acyl-CoA dehydrogenase